MTFHFCDYEGPKGLYVATGSKLLPLETPAAAVAFIGSAVQSGIGDHGEATKAQHMIDAAIANVGF